MSTVREHSGEGGLKLKPDLVVAFPGGAGTMDMARKASSAGIHVYHSAPSSPDSEENR